jgi:hypothetical protein
METYGELAMNVYFTPSVDTSLANASHRFADKVSQAIDEAAYLQGCHIAEKSSEVLLLVNTSIFAFGSTEDDETLCTGAVNRCIALDKIEYGNLDNKKAALLLVELRAEVIKQLSRVTGTWLVTSY